jgi:ABC-type phosphate transport system substrate-binding protein
MKYLLLIPFLALLAGPCVSFTGEDTGELAVVVNKSNPLDTISSADLRAMMLGDKTKWPDGKKVTAVETAGESRERALMLKVVCKMTEPVLKRYYMQAVFTGKDVVQPQEVSSAAALKQLVGRTPGGIGCIFGSQADDTVKILKVDGVAPGEPGYKLH